MAVQTEPQSKRDMRAIFRIANTFSLTRGDRIEIATVLLNREVASYSDLDPGELRQLRTALEGAVLVCKIQLERRRGERV